MTTMQDLYPDGAGYHDAHGPYIDAVALALEAAGFHTDDCFADANDPRDGWIGFDMGRQGTIDGRPLWQYEEVGVGWSENRGWHLLLADGRDSRNVQELAVGRVAAPVSVVLAVAEQAGLTLELPDDGHPDGDFSEHTFEVDDIPFELALRHYATATAPDSTEAQP
jgi:hypothetical protein